MREKASDKMKNYMFSKSNAIKETSDFFNANLQYIDKHIGEFRKKWFFGMAITGVASPTQIDGLGNCGNMPNLYNLKRCLIWYKEALIENSDYINQFIISKNAYDTAFLLGRYEKCTVILQEMRMRFGQSLWLIREQIALYAEMQNTENQKEQKRFVETIKREMKSTYDEKSFLLKYIEQCNDCVTWKTLFDELLAWCDTYENRTEYRLSHQKYIKFKLYGGMFLPEADVPDEKTLYFILQKADCASLIDRYLAFRRVVACVFIRCENSMRTKFMPHIAELRQFIADPAFETVSFFHENGYSCFVSSEDMRVYNAYECYVRGEYDDCKKIINDLLAKSINNFALIDLYSKCCYLTGEISPVNCGRGLINRIIICLVAIYGLEDDYEQRRNELLKILYLHQDSVWADNLFVILHENIRHKVYLPNINLQYAANFAQKITTSDSLYSFPPEKINEFLKTTFKDFREKLSVKLAVALQRRDLSLLESLPIDENCKTKYRAALLLDINPEAACDVLGKLVETNIDKHALLPLRIMQIEAELSSKQLSMAMEHFVLAYLEKKNFVYSGYLNRLVSTIKYNTKHANQSLCAAIIMDIYFKSSFSADEVSNILLKICCEQTIVAHGAQKPSDLLDNMTKISPTEIYFFSEVCVLNIIDWLSTLKKQEAVLNERIKLCRLLIEKDSDQKNIYEEELHLITNTLINESGKHEIENHKIFVNIDQIRLRMRKNVRELYEKYTPESLDILEKALKKTRDIFVTDTLYGLDGYLSTRIRHGPLKSCLWGYFEKKNLVTRMGTDKRYLDNTEWVQSNTSESKSINFHFANFSAKVNEIIKDLIEKTLQIHTDNENKSGLLDFIINKDDVKIFKEKLSVNANYEEFENKAIDYLLALTKNGLDVVQNLLKHEINRKFQDALDELLIAIKVRNKSCFKNYPELVRTIIEAKTDITYQLDAVSEWFKLSHVEKFDDYHLEQAISIASMMINGPSDHKHFYDDSEVDKQIKLVGMSMPPMVDIFYILLDNVKKHSGLNEEPHAKIKAYCSRDKRLTILVKNPICPGSVDESTLKHTLYNLRNSTYPAIVNKEGGSGLYKIDKLLKVDLLGDDISIDAYPNYDMFTIRIDVKLESMLL